MRVKRPPALLVTPEATSPCFVGIWTSKIVVPESLLTGTSAASLRHVFAHELAHLVRRDLWTNGLLLAARTLHWFNPVVWWVVAQMQAEREAACDELALIALGQEHRSVYAKTVVDLAANLLPTGIAPGMIGFFLSRPRLQSRIERLVRVSAVTAIRTPFTAVLLLGIALLGLTDAMPASLRTPGVPSPEKSSPTTTVDPVPRGEPQRFASALLRLGTNPFHSRDYSSDIAFSPDGKLLAAAGQNGNSPRVRLFDVQSGRMVKRIEVTEKPPGWVTCVAFSPDNSRLLWGEIGGLVALWDLKGGRLLFRDPFHEGRVNEVAFSRSGSLLATAGEDGELHVRRVDDPTKKFRSIKVEEKRPVPLKGPIAGGPFALRCVTFTRDERNVVVGGASTGDISIFALDDGALVQSLERAHGSPHGFGNPRLNHVAVTPDERHLMSSGQRTVPISETKLKYGPKNVTISEIRFWNIETGLLTKEFKSDDDFGFGYADLSSDGKRVAVGDFGLLRILDAETGKPLRLIKLPGSWGSQPRFSPDGTLVAMAMGDSIGLFDVQTGRRLHHDERMPDGGITSAAWSFSADRIATGHNDGKVRVWDAHTGQLIWTNLLAPVISRSGWTAHPAFVGCSSDGRRVVAAGRRDDPVEYRSGIVAVFNAADGRLLNETVTKRAIRYGILSPDGKVAIVGSSNGSWDDTHWHAIDIESGNLLFSTPAESKDAGYVQCSSTHFFADSTAFQMATDAGEIIRLHARTGSEQRRSTADYGFSIDPTSSRPRRLGIGNSAFSGDGRTLIFSVHPFLYIWDLEKETMRRKIRHPHNQGCYVAVSPDGKTFATSDLPSVGDFGRDTIRVYDLGSGQQIMSAEPDDDRAEILNFSPDGRKLLTGYQSGAVTVWDVRR